jgi:glycosyltransferase involved in cell wall biosynthesis
MEVDNPLVSVVILTYNHEAFVRDAIQCVLDQQTSFNFEIIIGDDFSTDNTRKIIDEFKKDYPDIIKTWYPDKNSGVLSNYSSCINLCHGMYFATCAGDDFWHNKSKLQKQVDFFNQHLGVGVVHSDADYLYLPSGKTIKSYHKSKKIIIKSGFIFEKLLLDNFIIALTAMVQFDLVKKFVDFEEYRRAGFLMEDYPMWLELSNHTKIEYLDESLATYRIHKKSIRNTENPAKLLEFLNSTFKVRNHFIARYGCSEEVKKRVAERYYQKVLLYSNALKNKSLAKDAWVWLRTRQSNIRWIEYLYYWSSRVRVINDISSLILKKFHLLG